MSSVIERLKGLVDDITATADGRDIRKLIAAYEAERAARKHNDLRPHGAATNRAILDWATKQTELDLAADRAARELEGE